MSAAPSSPREPPSVIRPSSVRRTLEIFIDPWTFAVLRETYFGVRRFEEFQRNLGISRNVLTKRLNHLVEHRIFERRLYQSRPDRYEYVLSERGIDMYPIFVAMMRWGDRWLDEGKGPPLRLFHDRCGHESRPRLACDVCGEEIDAREMSYAPGPGSDEEWAEGDRRAFEGVEA
jgi:DNA-binding HxlR family transcriptional regulator